MARFSRGAWLLTSDSRPKERPRQTTGLNAMGLN